MITVGTWPTTDGEIRLGESVSARPLDIKMNEEIVKEYFVSLGAEKAELKIKFPHESEIPFLKEHAPLSQRK